MIDFEKKFKIKQEKLMIELQNVSKTYDYKKSIGFFKKESVKVQAVEDISFKVDEGEKLGLIGLNGIVK